MTEIRNILLIGKTGSGKSTLANVLCNKNNNFEEMYKVGHTGKSKTSKVQVEQFESDGIIYRIIDTVGIGDTCSSKEDVLDKLKDISIIPNVSLNQILFTLNGKFTNEQIEYYNLLKEVIFDNNMENFTTIVRTSFVKFENSDICKEDKIDLENTENAIKNCKEIIHINNLSVDEQPGQESRKKSREILLNHLKACQEVYQPELLGKFHKIIEDFDSICNDTNQAIEAYIVDLKNAKNRIGEFISKRKRAMVELGLRKEDRSRSEKIRLGVNNVLNSVVILGGIANFSRAKPNTEFFVTAVFALTMMFSEGYAGKKESEDNDLLMKSLKDDEKLVEEVNKLWPDLINFKKKFSDIKSNFNNLGYKRLKINEKKIEAFDKILDKALASELEAFEGNAKIDINYSGGLPKFGRAILKCTFSGPIPSIYYFVRDIKCQIENKEPLSLSDIEGAIEELKKDLKSWEKREKSALSGEIEKFKTCKNEMTNLVTPKQKPIPSSHNIFT